MSTTLSAHRKTRLPKPRLLTYDDYARLTPPGSGHYELRNGTIEYRPSPTVSHQDICAEMSRKKSVYESAGVREYWLVLPAKGVLQQYENVEGEFMLRHELQKLDGFSLPLEGILP